jgi:hypothetical protein
MFAILRETTMTQRNARMKSKHRQSYAIYATADTEYQYNLYISNSTADTAYIYTS